MTKVEYLDQKNRLDDEVQSTLSQVDVIEDELANIPTPADFESLERFANKVRSRLSDDNYLKPEDKRLVLELLHVKVYLGLDGSVRVDGWYKDDDERDEETRDWLSSTTTACCGRQPVAFSITLTDAFFVEVKKVDLTLQA